MKLALVGITALLFAFFSTLSHASERPLLAKYNYPGFVQEEDYRVESCEVFQEGFLLKTVRSMETTERVERFELEIDVAEIEALINEAKFEALSEEDNYLCDAPSTSISAFGSRELNPEGKLTLFETGGCGTVHEKRSGPATDALMSLLNEYCPETHEASSGVEEKKHDDELFKDGLHIYIKTLRPIDL